MILKIYYGDNIKVLKKLESESVSLIYIDPPFNTGKKIVHTQQMMYSSEDGTRKGFGDKKYKSIDIGRITYDDDYGVQYHKMILNGLLEAHRILKPNGSLFFHIDYRECRHCGLLLDQVFGPESFINEIIWAYDYGARSKKKWPTKHDNILWYAKSSNDYIFNYDEIDRIPYMAPSLVSKEKAERGKTPTDVWWNTIVPTNGSERTGYPTQKPLAILERIVKVHSNPNDLLLDYFAGSGSFGEAAINHNRNVILVDNNKPAIKVMTRRFKMVEKTVYRV